MAEVMAATAGGWSHECPRHSGVGPHPADCACWLTPVGGGGTTSPDLRWLENVVTLLALTGPAAALAAWSLTLARSTVPFGRALTACVLLAWLVVLPVTAALTMMIRNWRRWVLLHRR